MSLALLEREKLEGNPVREWLHIYSGSDTSKNFDLIQDHRGIGLDFMIRNRGAGSLSIQINKSADSITVSGGGDSFTLDNTRYYHIKISNASGYNFDCYFAGVHISGL